MVIMEKVTPKWVDRIVFICALDRASKDKGKGGGSQKPSCGPQGANELRGWLKQRLKEDGLWKRVRVTTTSCLDLCSGRGVSLTIQGRSGDGDLRIVNAFEDREELYSEIVKGMNAE